MMYSRFSALWLPTWLPRVGVKYSFLATQIFILLEIVLGNTSIRLFHIGILALTLLFSEANVSLSRGPEACPCHPDSFPTVTSPIHYLVLMEQVAILPALF